MYTVTLQDYPQLPEELRLQAERRYARTLEKALGGIEGLAAAYKAWSWAEESADDISEEERSLALRWQRAAVKAAQEGFSALGETDSAYFEVRLER
ncbi:hypothetical protein N5K27_26930 [Pigmentiphaga sp. GD03639]|uniref:Uncharacterized protein n=1 Tax=Pigmentiphaga daeguensis TaxID=414049 RepID=A0ABN1B8I9_9BURK|nr:MULTISPECIES: hypothetical protein [unclassified Pigmentiphaga]MDH2239935.1 hypothetical protein [Pigmentiphaga sp. GD03639]OVZ62335.1 hypothetical protein CDO46_17030 [Pigmentiphaga sp. NML030171]